MISVQMIAFLLLSLVVLAVPPGASKRNQHPQDRRYVIIDQDAAGPAGTDLQSILVLLQAPNVDVLGITVVTGDQWRDEEAAHTLRLLEIAGRTDVPVVPGAVSPLVRTPEWTQSWEQRFGRVRYQGAWTRADSRHGPAEVPKLAEGQPTAKPLNEDAAHFLIRMVRKYPHQVTIYAGGPMTNLALALAIEPQFAELARELVFMGGSIHPRTDDPEFTTTPRREFNLWFDPEAAHIVLRAHWPTIVCTTVDVSVQTRFTSAMLAEIAKAQTPVAQYLAKYARPDRSYMWDELAAAAWLDPSLITKEQLVSMDVDLDRGATYGDTLTGPPVPGKPVVHAQMEADMAKLARLFVKLMIAPTPRPKPAN